MANFKQFLFDSLPPYFKLFDSNKDINGQGSLERFLDIFIGELNSSYQKIKNLNTLLSPGLVPDSHLYLLGGNFGKPPTLFLNNSAYRKLLIGFKWLMSYKGTLKGLTKLFNLFGATLEITDETPLSSIYDTNLRTDSLVKYDYVTPEFFIISIRIIDSNNFFTNEDVTSSEFISELTSLAYFMLPINVFISAIYIDTPIGFRLLDESGNYISVTNNLNILSINE